MITRDDLDIYGGYTGMTFPATGMFYLTKDGDRWWFVTPLGHACFQLGVGSTNLVGDVDDNGDTYSELVDIKYANPSGAADGFATAEDRWGWYTRERLQGWGFNTLGTFSYPPATAYNGDGSEDPIDFGSLGENPLPELFTNRAGAWSMRESDGYLVKNIYGSIFYTVTGSKPYFPDPFDPQFQQCQEDTADGLPNNVAWWAYVFMDQTDEMRGVNVGHTHLGMCAAAANYETLSDSQAFGGAIASYPDTKMYTKYAFSDFLLDRYGSLVALNTAWGASYTSWDTDGGWGTGTGVLDENGANLGSDWSTTDPTGKPGYTAVLDDMNDFAAVIIRQWFKTVYEAFKIHAGLPYILSTNNLDPPQQYVYEGLRSLDGTEVYADLAMVQNDPDSGVWYDVLGIPFHAWNLEGYFTAEDDSPLGVAGTISDFSVDGSSTITVTCNACDFSWAFNPEFGTVHHYLIQFDCLPPTITRGDRTEVQYYKINSDKTGWVNDTTFEVTPYGYYNGTYAELADAIAVGQTFKRVWDANTSGPFDTQEDRGGAYRTQLLAAVNARSPNGDYFNVGAHIWQWKDNTKMYWESYNFGVITNNDNAYDGLEAVFSQTTDSNGFTTIPEVQPTYMTDSGFGDFLTTVQEANFSVYEQRTGAPILPDGSSYYQYGTIINE